MYCVMRVCVCGPGQAVQGFDEVVPGPLVLLRALQQGGGGVHHVAGQETVLETKMDAKRLDPDVLHAGGDGGGIGRAGETEKERESETERDKAPHTDMTQAVGPRPVFY